MDSDELLSVAALSPATLAALQAVLAQRTAAEESAAADPFASEDWSKSQFVYTQDTASAVATEVFRLCPPGGSVACVSCPTLFRTLLEEHPSLRPHLFEFDEKYGARGSFSLYDYNSPLDVSPEHEAAFDVVCADPPYLAEECLSKTAQTLKLLRRSEASPVLLLTGAVMQTHALHLLAVRPAVFRPEHSNKLGNEFLCYASVEPLSLGGWDREEIADET